MTKMKCIIIDDEPIARKVLQEFIEEIDFLDLVGQAENPVKALSLIQDNDIDLIFLDISMPKISGLEFLASTRLTSKVILTTAYSEFAVQAYNLDVIDYVLKPIAFERFVQACNKAKAASKLITIAPSYTTRANDHFFVKCDGVLEKIFYNEVIYAEAKMNYVMIQVESRKLMVYLTIASLENQLPGDQFIKVHKSNIINKDKVKSIRGNVLDLGIREISISQNLRDQVLNRIVSDQLIRRQ
jgi:DNA-binding LytR/AlgR family response regulator